MKILHFYCAFSTCFGNVVLQNTYAATDPNGADVNDFPEEVRFFAEETRKNLPKKMREFYAWREFGQNATICSSSRSSTFINYILANWQGQ